jgi:hypothetical protein
VTEESATGRFLVLAAAICAAASTTAGLATASAAALPALPAGMGALSAAVLDADGLHRLAAVPWRSGSYLTTSGTVDVSVSPAYGGDPGTAQRWADFFSSLVHGPELAVLNAYIAPLAEVAEICRDDALGCYGANHLVTMGEDNFGVAAESVAAHEYGHHVAGNRLNAPWAAIDWGTKRWATDVGVCSRVASGMAFPGAEDSNYSLNPGEAFAESYRVLVETNGSAVGDDWELVDPSFRPDARALEAVREDVLDPWSGPKTWKLSGKFLRRSRTWSVSLATPLDGDLRIRLALPRTGGDDVQLFSSDGRTRLASSSWDASGGKTVEYRVCGTRSVKVRVSRGGAASRFSLRVTAP